MATLSTHILDTAKGKPATGVGVALEHFTGAGTPTSGGSWKRIGEGVTNEDGRVKELLGGTTLVVGHYRMVFATGDYLGEGAFYPYIEVPFFVAKAEGHYHIPLLLSPFGFSSYRGS
jgi:5-hydroxyisourate hydrolase